METLRGVFQTVPTEALLRVLEVCDQSVGVASSWLLENDWQDLMQDEAPDDEEEAANPTANTTTSAANVAVATESVAAPAPQNGPMVNSTQVPVAPGIAERRNAADTFPPPPPLPRGPLGLFGFEGEFDSEDEDEMAENDEEEEDDEDEDDAYIDSGDEAGFRVGVAPPLAKRVKVSKSEGKVGNEDFWVAFDDQVMAKSMIELLNTTLTKLAHSKVVLLNQPAKQVEEAEVIDKLRSVIPSRNTIDDVESPRDTSRNASHHRGIALSCLLNGGGPRVTSSSHAGDTGKSLGLSESPTEVTRDEHTGQKRKRTTEVSADCPARGFFAHFFPIRELDIVWRTVMHAHLFKSRFGDAIEFHTASTGTFTNRDFDELTHIQSSASSSRAASLGFTPLANLKCCLILPCSSDEEEILRVGRNLHSVLKLPGNLYYAVIGPSRKPSCDGPLKDDSKMTEERFRQFSRYRVREEKEKKEDSKRTNVGLDPYMSYQQQRKPSFSLEILEGDKWACRLTS